MRRLLADILANPRYHEKGGEAKARGTQKSGCRPALRAGNSGYGCELRRPHRATTTVFGAPTHVALFEIDLEMLYPTDRETERAVRSAP